MVVTDLARGLSDACSGGAEHLGELGAISADEAAGHIAEGLMERKVRGGVNRGGPGAVVAEWASVLCAHVCMAW